MMSMIPRNVILDTEGRIVSVGVPTLGMGPEKGHTHATLFLPTDHYDFAGPLAHKVVGMTTHEAAALVNSLVEALTLVVLMNDKPHFAVIPTYLLADMPVEEMHGSDVNYNLPGAVQDAICGLFYRFRLADVEEGEEGKYPDWSGYLIQGRDTQGATKVLFVSWIP